MTPTDLQQHLFQFLKEQLPPHISMVDELCELLDLSPDSVYRRIRGEKPITLTELKRICERYHLSLDQMLQLENESVIFSAPGLNNGPASMEDYLNGVLKQFQYFNSFDTKVIRYICKDAPIWYFYLFPELAAFKTFFWAKTINNQEDLQSARFSIKDFPYTSCYQTGQRIMEEYAKLESYELWNLESIHSTVSQINYYKETGIFASKDDEQQVRESLLKLIDHLEMQTEEGKKFKAGAGSSVYSAPLHFYTNELILGSNTILLSLGNQHLTMVTYRVLSYLITRDTRFFQSALANFEILKSKSSYISRTGEKERIRFFNAMRQRIQQP